MHLTKKHLSRRTMLRGVGAAVALPLLDAMIPANTALAQTAAAPMPKMGFVYFPHGAVQERWRPTATGSGFEFSEILKPLEPYRDYVTVVSGLRNRAGESSSPHAIMAGTWLGCVAPAVSHDPMGGITADQIAARHFGQDTPFPSIELATEGGGVCDPGYGCSYGNTISFRTPSQPLPMEFNPRKVFYRLFGQGDTADERRMIVDETSSILDSIAAEASSLKLDLAAHDRVMVDDYLASVREIERRVASVSAQDFSGLELPEAPVGVPNDFDEHLNLMFDMMALAYQANLTRVASFMMAKEVSMRSYNNLGISDAFHPLSHHQEDPAKMARLARVQTYHTEVFSRFVKKLAETPDGDGSLLDHSIILFGSNMSNSNRHNNDPLPSTIIGRGYGRIKGGQHLVYAQDTPHANLVLTLMERAGLPVETHGDSTSDLTDI
jgi:hypothetical protein